MVNLSNFKIHFLEFEHEHPETGVPALIFPWYTACLNVVYLTDSILFLSIKYHQNWKVEALIL